MTRNRASAKSAGTRLERAIADHLREHIDDRIDRRARNGNRDRGDIGGVRTPHGHRIVVECKDYGGRYEIGSWLNEAEVERRNDDALVGLVVAKRRGTASAADQVVLMTVRDLVALITGERQEGDK